MVVFSIERGGGMLDIYNTDNILKIKTDAVKLEIIIYFTDGSTERLNFESLETYTRILTEILKILKLKF